MAGDGVIEALRERVAQLKNFLSALQSDNVVSVPVQVDQIMNEVGELT